MSITGTRPTERLLLHLRSLRHTRQREAKIFLDVPSSIIIRHSIMDYFQSSCNSSLGITDLEREKGLHGNGTWQIIHYALYILYCLFMPGEIFGPNTPGPHPWSQISFHLLLWEAKVSIFRTLLVNGTCLECTIINSHYCSKPERYVSTTSMHGHNNFDDFPSFNTHILKWSHWPECSTCRQQFLAFRLSQL